MDENITEWTFKEYSLYRGHKALSKDEFKLIAKHLDHTPGKEKDRHIFQKVVIDKNYSLLGSEFLFRKIKINVDDASFILGLEPNDNFTAGMVLNYLIEKEKLDQVESFKIGFETILKPIQNEQENNDLIKMEIEFIKTEIEIGRTSLIPREYAFYLGFDNESRHLKEYQFKAPLTFETYRKTMEGAAAFHYLKYLKTLVDNIQHSEENLFSLETAFEKLLFIKYSGILSALMEQHIKADGSPHQRRIAKAISYLTNENFANINSYLPDLINDNKKSKAHDNLYKKETLEKAIRSLSDCDLPTKAAEEMLYKIINNRKD